MRWLITGGAGFIGSAVAAAFRDAGDEVVLVDDLSRAARDGGQEAQARRHWQLINQGFHLEVSDITVPGAVSAVLASHGPFDVILHLAAQAAVTTSVADPVDDARRNIFGAIEVLEAARNGVERPRIIFASSNKVYGNLPGVCEPVGVATPMLPRTPYGVSKASAQWYMREYAESYGVPTVTFVQSCISGPSAIQTASFDQGWMAHMATRAASDRRVTICGDGSQVRDVLHVLDLARAYRAAATVPLTHSMTLNIGGGPGNAISVNQWVDFLEVMLGHPVERTVVPDRPADQRYYVSRIDAARLALGWTPTIGWRTLGSELVAAARRRAAPAASVWAELDATP